MHNNNRYGRLDVLYLNAGIMPATGVDWKVVFKPDVSNFIHVVSTGGNVCAFHCACCALQLARVCVGDEAGRSRHKRRAAGGLCDKCIRAFRHGRIIVLHPFIRSSCAAIGPGAGRYHVHNQVLTPGPRCVSTGLVSHIDHTSAAYSGRIVFTSRRAAQDSAFNPDDIQHKHG